MINFARDNYTTPLPYIISRIITEYDISRANANILLYKGIIDKDEYETVLSMNRAHRQIYIGLKQRDEKISKALKEGFAEFREKFFVSNDLTEADIVSIKKDAIFVLDKKVRVVDFDNIHFAEKNVYTSYYRIARLEIFYLLDNINELEKIDVKGIDDEKLIRHQNYMINFLCIIFEMIQSSSISDVIQYIVQFAEKYRSMQLPTGYYREFNSDSAYRITVNGCNYITDFISDNEKQYLNVSVNYSFITELYKLATSIYYQYK